MGTCREIGSGGTRSGRAPVCKKNSKYKIPYSNSDGLGIWNFRIRIRIWNPSVCPAGLPLGRLLFKIFLPNDLGRLMVAGMAPPWGHENVRYFVF